MQDAGSQLLDLLGHGRAEHQILALGGQFGNDLFHVMDKAHVQHPVGLVQHKNFHISKVYKALSHKVVQTARARHQNVHTLLEGRDLRSLTHTAENDGVTKLQILAVLLKALADLQRQLAGGGQDEGTDGPLFPGRGRRQTVQHGQRERRRLAGSRLGAAH